MIIIVQNDRLRFFSESSGCFPSMTKIVLENGKSVIMSELKIGDKVKTGKKFKTFGIELCISLSSLIFNCGKGNLNQSTIMYSC